MEVSVYAADAAQEETHWWYVGRRRLFSRLLAQLGLPRGAAVLDVGTSSGTNLRLLKNSGFTNVTGLDMSPEAIRFCAEKGLGPVEQGDITRMPFSDARFDLVLATDILEHVDDDRGAMAEIARVVKPGGRVLITVPAFQSLWGFQDEVSHHKRRYARHALLDLIRGAGLTLERDFHFNYLLFGPIWLARQVMKLRRPAIRSEADINTPLINQVLSRVFAWDVDTAPVFQLPFGVSLLVIAQRPSAD